MSDKADPALTLIAETLQGYNLCLYAIVDMLDRRGTATRDQAAEWIENSLAVMPAGISHRLAALRALLMTLRIPVDPDRQRTDFRPLLILMQGGKADDEPRDPPPDESTRETLRLPGEDSPQSSDAPDPMPLGKSESDPGRDPESST